VLAKVSVTRIGRALSRAFENTGFTLDILVRSLVIFPRSVLTSRGFTAIVSQMYYCGVKALGVTSVVALFTGMIVALQVGIELKRYGQAETVGFLVAVSMCREMGPMITAIILTAMLGSTIAAEIGTMKVSEEIDALEVMSIDPIRMLVTPRVVAMTLMTFALTVLVDFVGVLGGALVAMARLGVSTRRYFEWAKRVFQNDEFLGFLPMDVYTGLTKALVFGLLISCIACSQGLRAKGGALGVGRAVRKTVVASIMLTLVLGYLMTAFFYSK
jgi:phospholipid/cholesterol/gamma-HCH transport system permease protein